MSCRVMGREVENTFLKEVIKRISRKKLKSVEAIFVRGPKNNIVENFYSQNGFKIIKKLKSKKIFSVNISDYLKNIKNDGPIKINYAK